MFRGCKSNYAKNVAKEIPMGPKKTQLVERLVSYDRHLNFKRNDDIPVSCEMDLPNALQYKNVHGDLTIPKISTNELKNTYMLWRIKRKI